MDATINDRVIGHQGNILLVDFTRKPDPPAPRFPGASGMVVDLKFLSRPTHAVAAWAASGAIRRPA